MKTCMRGCTASLTAFQTASMSSGDGARQAADGALLDFTGDAPDGLEVPRRRDRETGLDDVDPHAFQVMGYFQFFMKH